MPCSPTANGGPLEPDAQDIELPDVPPVDASSGETNGDGTAQSEAAAATSTTAISADDAADGSNDDGTTQKKPRTMCGVCEKEISKYQCPHCVVAFCSVTCSRKHRETHPPDSIPPRPRPQPAPPEQQKPPAAAAADRHPFSVLDDSPELRRLFARYPNLQSTLSRIHAATLPPAPATASSAPAPGGNRPGRLGGGLPWTLADVDPSLLNGGHGGGGKKHNNHHQRREEQQPWSQDVGLRRGRTALRKARMDPGEEGDGVREYCELVVHLLSSRDADQVAGEIVRREVTEDEVRLIEQLQLREAGD